LKALFVSASIWDSSLGFSFCPSEFISVQSSEEGKEQSVREALALERARERETEEGGEEEERGGEGEGGEEGEKGTAMGRN